MGEVATPARQRLRAAAVGSRHREKAMSVRRPSCAQRGEEKFVQASRAPLRGHRKPERHDGAVVHTFPGQVAVVATRK